MQWVTVKLENYAQVHLLVLGFCISVFSVPAGQGERCGKKGQRWERMPNIELEDDLQKNTLRLTITNPRKCRPFKYEESSSGTFDHYPFERLNTQKIRYNPSTNRNYYMLS